MDSSRSCARRIASCWLLLVGVVGCGDSSDDSSRAEPVAAIDGVVMLDHLRFLSADSLEGRATGTDGNRKAREYIERIFSAVGVASFDGGYAREFVIASGDEETVGVNVVGFVTGRGIPDRFIVVTAHFDHLGVRGGEIYNGADDNGSGTAGLLELAAYFAGHPARHSLIFAAVDGEEVGLRGARRFVAEPPVPLDRIVLNVNLDMVSHSDSVLYAAGTHHHQELLAPLVAVAEPPVALRFGHDSPDLSQGDDWTGSSDHAPFHQAGIPFVYFGVEDHPDYHRASDTFDTINREFYLAAVETVRRAIVALDEHFADANRPGTQSAPSGDAP